MPEVVSPFLIEVRRRIPQTRSYSVSLDHTSEEKIALIVSEEKIEA